MAAKLKINDETFQLYADCNLRSSCIYKITDSESGRIYIGKAKSLLRRYNDHKSALKCNRHYNSILQKTYNKGRNLIMEVLEIVENYDVIDDIELEYINKYESFNKSKGMNIIKEKLPTRPKRKIDVYDKNYNFIKTCDGVVDVVDEFNVNRSSIIMICRDRGYYHFTKNGYYFRYHGDPIVKHIKN